MGASMPEEDGSRLHPKVDHQAEGRSVYGAVSLSNYIVR